MVKLIGTGGNQVPTNNMLGNMAFQNKEGVAIDLLGLAAGTAASPSLIPTGDPNTGVWFPAADTVAVSTGGTERVRVTSTGLVGIGSNNPPEKLTVGAGNIRLDSGQGVFWGGTENYIYGNHASDFIAIVTNNVEIIRFEQSGNVGIGTTTPSDKFTVNGRGFFNSGVRLGTAYSALDVATGASGLYLSGAQGALNHMFINPSGNVGIGTIAPAFKLEVTGTAFISTSLRTPQINNNGGVIGIEGNTSAFPGIKRSATTLQVRLADDTADAPLSSSTINATTIPVNTPAIATSGFSLTGNNAFSLMDLAGQWNTTGNPSAIRLNVTNIASGASSLLMELGTTDIGVYTARFTVSKAGNVTLADGGNLSVGLSTGTKIGTATSQKIGFWNVTPIIQPTTSVAAATFVANSGTAVNDASTFDGYTISKVVKALRNLGILA